MHDPIPFPFWRNTVKSILPVRTGICPEEYLAPQKVCLTATVWIPGDRISSLAGIANVVNYHTIYEAMEAEGKHEHTDLIETIACRLMHAAMAADERISHAVVTVEKLAIYGDNASPSVTLACSRADLSCLPAII
jgi:FolB domain-containing protein